MKHEKYFLSSLALAIALSVSGCGDKPKDGGDVIKIGSVAPLTGPQTNIGKDNENGARLAVDEINAKGLELDGKKMKLELLGEETGVERTVGGHAPPRRQETEFRLHRKMVQQPGQHLHQQAAVGVIQLQPQRQPVGPAAGAAQPFMAGAPEPPGGVTGQRARE